MELSSKQLTSTFPNVDTVLRMFLCMPIANCFGERSFSALKRVKNYLRYTIGQQQMDSLSLLTIECDLANIIEYDDDIDTFSECKARKNNYNKLETYRTLLSLFFSEADDNK